MHAARRGEGRQQSPIACRTRCGSRSPGPAWLSRRLDKQAAARTRSQVPPQPPSDDAVAGTDSLSAAHKAQHIKPARSKDENAQRQRAETADLFPVFFLAGRFFAELLSCCSVLALT